VPEDAVRQGIDRPFPPLDEVVEAVGVAALTPRDELLVGRRDGERKLLQVCLLERSAFGL
jgi:hypothetical protein